MQQPDIPEVWEILTIIVVSTISGAISISKRILKGYPTSMLWVITEYATAVLCGYLMYSAYPAVASHLPEWITPTVAIAVAAHSGGRVFQECENTLMAWVEQHLPNRNKSKKD